MLTGLPWVFSVHMANAGVNSSIRQGLSCKTLQYRNWSRNIPVEVTHPAHKTILWTVYQSSSIPSIILLAKVILYWMISEETIIWKSKNTTFQMILRIAQPNFRYRKSYALAKHRYITHDSFTKPNNSSPSSNLLCPEAINFSSYLCNVLL
jgi:hypothetical protein